MNCKKSCVDCPDVLRYCGLTVLITLARRRLSLMLRGLFAEIITPSALCYARDQLICGTVLLPLCSAAVLDYPSLASLRPRNSFVGNDRRSARVFLNLECDHAHTDTYGATHVPQNIKARDNNTECRDGTQYDDRIPLV